MKLLGCDGGVDSGGDLGAQIGEGGVEVGEEKRWIGSVVSAAAEVEEVGLRIGDGCVMMMMIPYKQYDDDDDFKSEKHFRREERWIGVGKDLNSNE